MPVEELRRLSTWATGGLLADLVILLDVPAGEAAARREASGAPADRLEAESEEFHRRVAEGFRCLAVGDPTWVVVDGTGTIDEVAARVAAVVAERLG